MARRLLIAAMSTAAGGAALFVLGFFVFVQLQRRAMDNCVVHLDGGAVSVHWKSWLPPHYVCAQSGREVEHLPPIR